MVLETIEQGDLSEEIFRAPAPVNFNAYLNGRQMALIQAAMLCTRPDIPLAHYSAYAVFMLLERTGAAYARDPAACPAFTEARGATRASPSAGIAAASVAWGGDPWFRAIARRLAIPLSGMETSAEVLAHWAATPTPVMLRMVARFADMHLQAPAAMEEMNEAIPTRLVRMLQDGDFDGLHATVLRLYTGEEEGEDARSLGAHILDARNRVMADRLAPRLRRESLVVTAGAAHFGGAASLQALLRAAGFRVEPIRVPTMVPLSLRNPPASPSRD